MNQQKNGVPNVMGKMRPSLRNQLGFRGKVESALAVPRGVMQRQRLHRCAAEMQRPCSARVLAFLATARDVFACDKIASGFNSRRLEGRSRAIPPRIRAENQPAELFPKMISTDGELESLSLGSPQEIERAPLYSQTCQCPSATGNSGPAAVDRESTYPGRFSSAMPVVVGSRHGIRRLAFALTC